MANFTIVNTTAFANPAGAAQGAVTTTYKTQISINNSTTSTNSAATTGLLRRGKLYDILVGTNGTPADNFMEWDVARIAGGTASASLGSISSVSSNFGLDPADNYGLVNVAGINSSAESIISSTFLEAWYVGVNQRASYRWVAAPGSEIVWPAATSGSYNGLAGRVRSGGYTGTATMNWLVQEQ